jgi:hypothetical protein
VKASSYAYITFRFTDVLAAGFPSANNGGTSPDNNRPALVTKEDFSTRLATSQIAGMN